MEQVKVETPLTDEVIAKLRVGQQVLLNGKIYTGRDATHKKFFCYLRENGKTPFDVDLRGQVLYYVGPTPAQPGKSLGAYGPTTSKRMDSFLPEVLALGIKGTIGKGCRSPEAIHSLIFYKAVYFVAVGGVAALFSNCIKKSRVIAFPELGPEAFRELEVVDFPVFVANDIYGGDIYAEAIKRYARI